MIDDRIKKIENILEFDEEFEKYIMSMEDDLIHVPEGLSEQTKAKIKAERFITGSSKIIKYLKVASFAIIMTVISEIILSTNVNADFIKESDRETNVRNNAEVTRKEDDDIFMIKDLKKCVNEFSNFMITPIELGGK